MKLARRIWNAAGTRLSLQGLVELVHRVAGGWYYENVYYRWRIHSKPRRAQLFWGLAFLPLAVARRLTSAATRRMELTRVELPVTSRCSLRCRDCANLIPFYPSPVDGDADALIRDINDFLGAVDQVHSFAVMGGEAFLHPELARVIAHLTRQDKIATVQVATNGTIVPPEVVLRLLAHKKVVVSISDYPDAIARNKVTLLARLKEYGVNCVLREGMVWKDLGGFAPCVDNSDAALINRFKHCIFKQFHTLTNGSFHLCPRSAHGSQLGQFPFEPSDAVYFRGRNDQRRVRAELKKLCRKKTLAACTKCKGGEETITPGFQLAAREHRSPAK